MSSLEIDPDTNQPLIIAAIDFGTANTGAVVHLPEKESENLSVPLVQSLANVKLPTFCEVSSSKPYDIVSVAAEALNQIFTSENFFFRSPKMLLYGGDGNQVMESTAYGSDENLKLTVQDLITRWLCFIRDKVLSYLASQGVQGKSPDQIMWVLTVPAIWKESSKQVMMNAAKEAGIYVPVENGLRNFRLALEPECAAIICANNVPALKKSGAKYLVFDCGGGTIDSVAHRVEGEGRLTELLSPRGNDFGATKLDEQILNFLHHITGVEQFEEAELTLFLGEQYEKKFKTAVNTGSKKVALNLSTLITNDANLPERAMDWNKDQPEELHLRTVGQFTVQLPYELIKKLYEPVMKEIRGLLRSILEELKSGDKMVDYLLLIGGFSESKMLQQEVRTICDEYDITLYSPPRPGIAVMQGAALFGKLPVKVDGKGGFDSDIPHVDRRYVPRTYGVEIQVDFQPGVMDVSLAKRINGRLKIPHVFNPIIEKGKLIQSDDVVRREFTPQAGEDKIDIRVFCVDEDKPYPDFTTDERCKELFTLKVDVDPSRNPRENTIEVGFKFGSTAIEATAGCKQTESTQSHEITYN